MAELDDVIAAGPYQATWESLKQYVAPQWYQDGKFGIFIHWGVYAVPAFGNEWYPRNMYLQGTPEFEHHVATYGPQKQFGYKDFIPRFRAERFNAGEWASLFKEAGARYVVPVAEHHDGFAMYDCSFTRWKATAMGPRRDVIGELAAAARQAGLVFGLSSHRAEHWWFMNGGRQFDSDVNDPAYEDFYGPAAPEGSQPDKAYLDDWLGRTCELVDRYQPQLVWFDWWIEQPVFEPYLRRFAAYYYNRGSRWGIAGAGPGVAINFKNKAFPEEAAVYDIERGLASEIRPVFWQTDTSISRNSWGYVSEQDYKPAREIIEDLADIVSKNGALLLNVGPRPDGTIPEAEQEVLRSIGRWLSRNGEAIYGTRPWRVFGEGPTVQPVGMMSERQRLAYTAQDIRFTSKGDRLFAICLGQPGSALNIKALGRRSGLWPGEVRQVHLLGRPAPLAFQREDEQLSVQLPDRGRFEAPIALEIRG